MKSIKTIFLSCLLIAGLAMSCTNEIEESFQDADSYLKIEAVVDGIARAAIDATNFSQGDAIGLFVRDTGGNAYNFTQSCSNIKATFDGNKWNVASNIQLVKDKEAVVYAYYPYNANINIVGDSIDIDVTKQDDILYGSATGVTYENQTAKIKFNHALARITLAITKGLNDVGEGVVKSVSLRNGPRYFKDHSGLIPKGTSSYISLKGRMSLVDGQIKKTTNVESVISVTPQLVISEKEQKVDILLMPCRTGILISTDIPTAEIVLNIDGYDFKKSISKPNWSSGTQYTYSMRIIRTVDYGNQPAKKVYMGSKADNGKPLYWASYNIGATSPEDYGGLYGWGDITGKYSSEILSDYPSANPPMDLNTSDYNFPAKKWGDGWRYPTNGEFWSLKAYCNNPEFVTVNGIDCVKYTSKVNGNVLYFPAAPIRIGTAVTMGQQSYYWLNKLNEDDATKAGTFYLDFYWKNAWPTAGQPRYYGLPIRPVTEQE